MDPSLTNSQELLPRRVREGRRPPLAKLDGRSKTARFLKKAEHDLLSEIRGTPNIGQRILARTTAAKLIRLYELEAELAADGAQPFDDHRWLQWMGSLEKSLAALGLEPERDGKGYRAPDKRGTGGITPAKRDGGTLADYAALKANAA